MLVEKYTVTQRYDILDKYYEQKLLILNLFFLFQWRMFCVCVCPRALTSDYLCARAPNSPAGPLPCQSGGPVVCLAGPVISRLSHLAIVSPICSTLSNLLSLSLFTSLCLSPTGPSGY